MAAKPEIQYVGQFYIYGSEAKKLEPKRQEKKKNTVLEQPKSEQTRVVSVDPVALIGLEDGQVMADAETKTLTAASEEGVRKDSNGGQLSSFSSCHSGSSCTCCQMEL